MGKSRFLELLTTKAVTCSTPATIYQLVVPCTKGLALILLTLCPLAGAATYRVNAGADSSMIQRIVRRALSGDTVSFEAGTYPITSTVMLKCGITYTGPVATPATAELTTSTPNISLLRIAGGCTSGIPTTIEYLHLNGAGAFASDGNSYSNIKILHNQFTSIPSEYCGAGCNQPCVSCQSIYFNFNSGTTLQNIDIEYNTFGDANSCTASAGNVPFSVISNNFPGNCAGVIIASQNPGAVNNLTLSHNVFYHLEEGFHMLNVGFSAYAPDSYCNNCNVEYNWFSGIRRIQLEYQAQLWTNPLHIRYNVMGAPDYSSANAGQYAFSVSCCQFGQTFGGSMNGAYIDVSSNIIYDPNPTTSGTNGISWGAEAWGYSSQYEHNLIQGYVCVGLIWGIVDTASQFSNNTIQGSVMSGGTTCTFAGGGAGGYIGQEFSGAPPGQGNVPPTQTGNVFGSTPGSIASASPTISPLSGTQSFPLTVTLTDPGYTSGPQPLANTGIWYTTDGSKPVPGRGTAQRLDDGGSFILPSAATVTAVGMWGAASQPTSYPRGYGFVPSEVKSATYNSGVTSQPRRPR